MSIFARHFGPQNRLGGQITNRLAQIRFILLLKIARRFGLLKSVLLGGFAPHRLANFQRHFNRLSAQQVALPLLYSIERSTHARTYACTYRGNKFDKSDLRLAGASS